MTTLLKDRQFPSLCGMPGSKPWVALAPPSAQVGATHAAPPSTPQDKPSHPHVKGRLLQKLSLDRPTGHALARGAPERERRSPTVPENSGALVTLDASGWLLVLLFLPVSSSGRLCPLSALDPGWRRVTTWWVGT